MTSNEPVKNWSFVSSNEPVKNAPNVSGFIAQLVRASHRYREVPVRRRDGLFVGLWSYNVLKDF